MNLIGVRAGMTLIGVRVGVRTVVWVPLGCIYVTVGLVGG